MFVKWMEMKEELQLPSTFPGCPLIRECSVKENSDKKNQLIGFYIRGTMAANGSNNS